MDTLKKHKKTFLALAGAAAAGLGIYYFFKDEDAEEVPQPKVAKRKPGDPLPKHEKSNILVGLIAKRNDINNVEVLKLIEESITKISSPEFYNILTEYRSERRACKDDFQKQVKLWDSYNKKLGELIDRSRKEILSMMNISESSFDDAKQKHANDSDYASLQTNLPFKFLEKIAVKKEMTLEKYIEVIKAQIQFLEEESTRAEEIKRNFANPLDIQPIMTIRLYDFTYEKFQIEEEEFFTPYYAYMGNDQVIELSNQVSMALMNFTI